MEKIAPPAKFAGLFTQLKLKAGVQIAKLVCYQALRLKLDRGIYVQFAVGAPSAHRFQLPTSGTSGRSGFVEDPRALGQVSDSRLGGRFR